jgi:hypothetical protein
VRHGSHTSPSAVVSSHRGLWRPGASALIVTVAIDIQLPGRGMPTGRWVLGDTHVRVADVAEVWREHRRWSNTANRLKRSIEFWRGAALGLAILGAVLATVASQSGQGSSWARWTSGLAAVALALVPVIRGARLGRSAVEAWTRARSASEALKSAAYLYCTRTPPYAGEDRDLELRRGANAIVADVGDLEGRTLGVPDSDKPVPAVTDVNSYLESRVQPQIDTYYRARAAQLQKRLRLFRGAEYALAMLAAGLGAVAATTGTVGLAGWVAAVTTVGAAVTAHIAAARYEHLVISYLATARQLRFLVGSWNGGVHRDAQDAARLVQECEDAISRENESWMAAWSRDEGATQPAAGS